MSKSASPSSSSGSSPSGLFIDSPSNKWMIGSCLGNGACGAVYSLDKVLKVRGVPVPAVGNHSPSNFVIKVTPLPKTSTNKKKKKSDLEKNADLLYFENTLYRNVFNDLRGLHIPEIPIAGYSSSSSSSNDIPIPPIGFGDIDCTRSDSCSGYRFLIMERMQYPFHYIVPLLFNCHDKQTQTQTQTKQLKQSKQQKQHFIPVGIIASRLIDLIEKIHDTQRLFVDVKPENFMIAKSKKISTSSSSSTMIQHIANRIRMIDFGLVESIKDASNNKHRIDNYPNSQVVGTPVYASLNVLSGHTISRRDDLESVGYVIVELILQIMDYDQQRMMKKSSSRTVTGTKRRKHVEENNFVNDNVDNSDGITNDKVQNIDLNVLPWSNNGAKSDDEIFTMKKSAMQRKNGSLWKKMLHSSHNHLDDNDDNDDDIVIDDDHVSEVMKDYFDRVMKLEYREKPDYDLLKALVSQLKVEVLSTRGTGSGIDKSAKAAVKKSTSSSTSTRRTTRNAVKNETIDIHDDDDAVMASPAVTSTHKRKTRTSRNAAESEVMLTKTICGGKARKKRITKTTVTTTETVEIIEGDDDDDYLDAKEKIENDSDVEMHSVHGADDDDHTGHDDSVDVSFLSCNSMDWETIANDENIASASTLNVNQSTTNASNERMSNAVGLKLECIEGCHKGLFLNLTGEMIIGKNPKKGMKNKKDKITFQINDANASDVHTKLVLNKSGKKKVLLTVRVSDMKSQHGTFVNGKKVIGNGKQAFVNDKIKIGDCVFCIRQGE